MIEHITEEIYQYVLQEVDLNVNFQPIISISKRKMIGFESLLRAFYQGEFISPESLFTYAKGKQDIVTLDTICQKKALQSYKESRQDRLLFINIETSLIENYLENMNLIISNIDVLQIPRGKIVIEINEKRADNNSKLVDLVNAFRKAGFLIALDDVGAGYSNLHRIVLAKPDIIKVDRSVIYHINKNYYKQEVLRAITDLGQKIGAITIAEGVEEENEVITCVSCGVDWFQGYYFAKAVAPKDVHSAGYADKCESISFHYQKQAITDMTGLFKLVKDRKQAFNTLINRIVKEASSNLEETMNSFLDSTVDIECIYAIDKNGSQITDTIFHSDSEFKNQEMFSPMRIGDCHISKPYYNFAYHKKNNIYVSTEYISLATGNFCQTLSKCIKIKGEQEIIVCVDFVIT